MEKEKEQAQNQEQERLESLWELADRVLEKVRLRLEDTDPRELTPQAMKHISSTMKDIKDLQMLRAPWESAQKEQTLRVALETELEELAK